jgi:hypothetical protein
LLISQKISAKRNAKNHISKVKIYIFFQNDPKPAGKAQYLAIKIKIVLTNFMKKSLLYFFENFIFQGKLLTLD